MFRSSATIWQKVISRSKSLHWPSCISYIKVGRIWLFLKIGLFREKRHQLLKIYISFRLFTDEPVNSRLAVTSLLRTFAITDKIQIPIYRDLTENNSRCYGLTLFRTQNEVPKVSAITRVDCKAKRVCIKTRSTRSLTSTQRLGI